MPQLQRRRLYTSHEAALEQALLFVNKKKQKNFLTLGLGRRISQRPWPEVIEVF
jgi:hypothetical protein